MKLIACCAVAALAVFPVVHVHGAAKEHPVARALAVADGDSNGQVTFDELLKVRPNLTPEQYKRLDEDADSVLTEADLPNGTRDESIDGKITRDEAKKNVPALSDDAFDRLDTNDDGTISGQDRQGEAQRARMRDRLHRADIDRDGKVTYQEARQEFPEMTEERFNRFDTSGDGYLTQEDVPKRGERPPLAERLRKADTNNDGKVTFDEARAEFPNIDQAGFDRFDRDGDGVLTARDVGKSWTAPDSGNGVKQQAAAKALSADVNGDGRVTFEELVSVKPGYPREAFDRIDQNKDGVVTADEAAQVQ